MNIKNMKTLISHGNINGRKIVLAMLESGLKATDPYTNAKKLIRIQDDNIIIGHKDFPVKNSEGQV